MELFKNGKNNSDDEFRDIFNCVICYGMVVQAHMCPQCSRMAC